MNEVVKARAAPPSGSPALSRWDRFLRHRFLAVMQSLRGGCLELRDDCGAVVLGSSTNPDLEVAVQVLDMAFYRLVASQGSIGAAEAYMDEQWTCDDLVALIRLLVRNRDLLDGMETGTARMAGYVLRLWHALRRNTHSGSRRNIAAHYDLGNEFFRLFLSPDLMYSSAVWEDNDTDTLESASERKLQLICSKLQLSSQDRVLEIGSGWGGFAVHAARHYGCRVTTITISREQYEFARHRIQAEGLSDKIEVLLRDYRDIEGQFDKLVSIEMIEAIGSHYLDDYFRQLTRLLKPSGLALVQAITIEDHRYARALRSVDFIKRYIFPGSFIPSINAMIAAKSRTSDLALIHLEDFGESYARTLRAWRQRFLARSERVRALGFDERFVRMWDFYLAYCEGGFMEGSIGVAHLLMRKPSGAASGTETLPGTARHFRC